jgi:hypothetical protein
MRAFAAGFALVATGIGDPLHQQLALLFGRPGSLPAEATNPSNHRCFTTADLDGSECPQPEIWTYAYA